MAGTADPPAVVATRESVRQLLTERADTDVAELKRLIVADPSVAANVMRVAASPMHQPRSPIESLQQAINWLGIAEVPGIALTASVRADLRTVRGQQQRLQR